RIGNYSAHADQSELVDWVMERSPVLGGLFLNHGEDEGRVGMRDALVARGFPVEKIFLPRFDESFDLVADTVQSQGRVAHRVDDAMLESDWHNEFAAFTLDLAEKLRAGKDDEARRKLIRKLATALDA
ncbi:MAG TPA: MBL fold metallo-hydrolase RNA specificity domain-containing protein, partial [Planctomycetota bacterium]|nr:MBL fold metallo-hydrolase RNA specificity domain-containing protein [Planctomycetota bacterium]